MKRHNDKPNSKRFIGASRRTGSYRTIGALNVGGTPPTLTEQGIDVDALIVENRALIEAMRKGNH